MLTSNNSQTSQQAFIDAWHKYQAKQLLTPLESQRVSVILDHSEYHAFLTQNDADSDAIIDDNEINPFLHMSMHLTMRDQVSLDRPVGTRAVFERLLLSMGEAVLVEHEMMHVLTEHIWISLKQQQPFNVSEYMDRLQRL